MSKTKHSSFKCNLCGVDSNTNVSMTGYSSINGRRFTRPVGEAEVHICTDCLKALQR